MAFADLEPADKIRHYFAQNDLLALYDVFITAYTENTKSSIHPCGHILADDSKQGVRETIYTATEPESILECLLALIDIYKQDIPS